jgi:hypothetical protein
MGLPGVKVGPLNPDSTAEFGQVSGTTSARSLIRLHTRAHPPALVQALSLKLDPERTKALDLEEVEDYLAGEKLENGDPVVPKDARVVGCAVRGERDGPQVLTFVYALPSGRTAKWFADYTEDALPDSYAEGTENVRIDELRKRGLVAAEHNAGEGLDRVKKDPEKSRLQRENERLRRELEAAQAAAPQSVTTPEADGEDDGDGDDGSGDGEKQQAAAESEPVEGYDKLKAPEAAKLVKSEDTDDETRQRILDYEKTHANRKGVVAAAEESLGARGNPE